MIDTIFIEPTREAFVGLAERPKIEQQDLTSFVSSIFDKVKEGKDRALFNLTFQYDKVRLSKIEVGDDEIQNAEKEISLTLKQAIRLAKDNITKFHEAQVVPNVKVDTMEGVRCFQKAIGIDRVGLYIPGGTAPLFSTVMMLAIPASLMGCKQVILCTPPDQSGNISPAILYAANICGVHKIYKMGGAQAIAAMTLGTESIPKVDKLFGPGNQYVTAAKQYAQKYGVGMDLPAGPSELLVYADASAIPNFVAADLLSQAEHGMDSQVVLVAKNDKIAKEVLSEISKQIKKIEREEIAIQSLKNSKIIVLSDEIKAFKFINYYAPEHLIIASENPTKYIDYITNAGSVFLGNYCPESAGDYASGTNHTLPTDGWSKSYNGVNVDSFCRKVTFQEISKMGIQNLGQAVIEMATHEQLEAHANAIKIRLESLKTEKR